MKLTFCGAAEQVTGSNFLVESGTKKILVDCGLHQGSSFAEKENYKPFLYNPKEISAVFLTHAHVDHIGLVPKLIKEGFHGKIFSTEPTKKLAYHLLLDALSLMEHDRKDPGEELLYTETDIEKALSLWQAVKYHEKVDIEAFHAHFYNAGHILGSSSVVISGEGKNMVFSGDLGNMPAPLLDPIEYIEDMKIDYAVMEATYGGRLHDSHAEIKDKLEDAVEDAVRLGGVLMIPAFATERTQDLLYNINQLVEEERIPSVPVFVDSPLAIKLTDVFEEFQDYLNDEIVAKLKKGKKLFSFPGLKKTLTVAESKAINDVKVPKIIIAGSGMSNGGRIQHHERRYLSDQKSTLLFVGYQAKGSPGRQILEGATEIKMFGETITIRCKKVMIEAYSAHADQSQLLKWLEPMRLSLKKVFLVHSERDQSEAISQRIRDELGFDADIPKIGDIIEL